MVFFIVSCSKSSGSGTSANAQSITQVDNSGVFVAQSSNSSSSNSGNNNTKSSEYSVEEKFRGSFLWKEPAGDTEHKLIIKEDKMIKLQRGTSRETRKYIDWESESEEEQWADVVCTIGNDFYIGLFYSDYIKTGKFTNKSMQNCIAGKFQDVDTLIMNEWGDGHRDVVFKRIEP